MSDALPAVYHIPEKPFGTGTGLFPDAVWRYEELMKAQQEAHEARVLAALEEHRTGRVKIGSVEDLIRQLGLID